jgi:hypothetical protein
LVYGLEVFCAAAMLRIEKVPLFFRELQEFPFYDPCEILV